MFLLGAVLCCAASAADITQFGAVGDGATLNTRAIQSAIDAAAAAGGGDVQFPAGKYLTGTLFLKSGVHLCLAKGAVLLGSPNLADYPLTRCVYPSRSDQYTLRALIWGEGLTDVSISGPRYHRRAGRAV